MLDKSFLKAGHPPTLLAAFFYFDMSFMVWVMLGPLGVQIANDLNLDAAKKGLMVAVPLLSGALLRVVNGIGVDRIGPKATGVIGQCIVIAGLLLAWYFGIHLFEQILGLGAVLASASRTLRVLE
jgi:MFS transporter, NNP family, nitrate/nitrite transporter